MVIPRGAEALQVGDRIIVIGSPQAAREWSAIMSVDRKRVDDVVIFGAGRIGVSVARMLLGQQVRVRLIEADRDRARMVAEKLPTARVFHATGIEPDFLERERIGHARAAIFAMRDDAKNLYASTLAKLHGVDFTIAVVHEQISEQVFESAGVDVVVNPRQVTAEELVRFAHDPRTLQVSMLEGDKYEVLDVRVRGESEYANRRFGDMPATGRAHRRDRAQRRRDLPAPRRRAPPGRPRDRVQRVRPRALGREDAVVPTITRARLRRMTRRETVGVDVAASVHLVGVLIRYLGPALLVPVPLAFAYGDSPWPFVLAAARHHCRGPRRSRSWAAPAVASGRGRASSSSR